MKSFAAILSLAVLAAAHVPSTLQQANTACGGNVLSCCNAAGEADSTGLLSGLVGPILSGACNGVGVNALNILGELADTQSVCGNSEVKCCVGNKNSGLLVVDASCSTL